MRYIILTASARKHVPSDTQEPQAKNNPIWPEQPITICSIGWDCSERDLQGLHISGIISQANDLFMLRNRRAIIEKENVDVRTIDARINEFGKFDTLKNATGEDRAIVTEGDVL